MKKSGVAELGKIYASSFNSATLEIAHALGREVWLDIDLSK